MTTLEQQRANARAWVNALRSGKYRQGKRRLESDGRFCCLGVLSALAGCERFVRRYDDGESATYDMSDTIAPQRARDYIGLVSASGSTIDGHALAKINDDGGSFLEIADIIEAEIEGHTKRGLFVWSMPEKSE